MEEVPADILVSPSLALMYGNKMFAHRQVLRVMSVNIVGPVPTLI